MDDDETLRLHAQISRERRSHQITWFLVLQIAGIFAAATAFPSMGWLFFMSTWAVTFAAWFASKRLAGLTRDDEKQA